MINVVATVAIRWCESSASRQLVTHHADVAVDAIPCALLDINRAYIVESRTLAATRLGIRNTLEKDTDMPRISA